MKKIFYTLLIVLGINSITNAQVLPRWKFYLAFEDAIGAKDSVWFIVDTNTNANYTNNIANDSAVTIDTTIFNAFWVGVNDTFKTATFDYYDMSIGSGVGINIEGINFVNPVTVRWDTTLLKSVYIPSSLGYINYAIMGGNYFFFNNNDPPLNAFNLLIDDSVVCGPIGGQQLFELFPFTLEIASDSARLVKNKEVIKSKNYEVYPNPALNLVTVKTSSKKANVFILKNMLGEKILNFAFNEKLEIDISFLPPGIYVYTISNGFEKPIYGKLIKN